jgi:glutathione S-transferase
MTSTLYLHPFSSYCQKAKIAFYEKGVAFETKMLDGSEPVAGEFAALWQVRQIPGPGSCS